MSDLIMLGDLAPVDMPRLEIASDARVARAGMVLANLEAPLGSVGLTPRAKAGPHLRGTASALRPFLAAWRRLHLTLANNHTMDYGAEGLRETASALREVGVPFAGAGETLAAAEAPLVTQLGALKVAVIPACDRWFGSAERDRPGVSVLGPDFCARIRRHRAEVDRVIVSVHGGGEMNPWPSPRWQQALRAMVEAGADVVHAHHPHVPLGWERWATGWIFYGLGNTVVNPREWSQEAWSRRSWRVQLDLAALDAVPQISQWEVNAGNDGVVQLVCTHDVVDENTPGVRDRLRVLAHPELLEGLHQEYALRVWNAFYADRMNLAETGRRRIRLLARTARDLCLVLARPRRWREHLRARQLFHYHLFASAGHAEEIATALGVLTGEIVDRRSEETRALADAGMPAHV